MQLKWMKRPDWNEYTDHEFGLAMEKYADWLEKERWFYKCYYEGLDVIIALNKPDQ